MTDDAQVDGREKHPSLIVWCADTQAGAPVLAALGQGFDLDMRDRLPKPGKAGAKGPDILLLCLSPVETLCRAMAGGVVPSVALKGWQDQAQAIMALNRRNRRKVRILDIDMARRHSGAFLHWFGLRNDAGDTAPAPETTTQSPPERDQILHLLAHRTLLGDAPARRLLAELEAVSLSFSEDGFLEAGDADAAFQSYQDMRHAREQATLAQAQGRATLQELETLSIDRQQLETALKQANAESHEVREQVALSQAQGRATLQELETLSRDRQQLEVALKQANAQSHEAREQATLSLAQGRAAHQELETLSRDRQQLEVAREQAVEETGQLRRQGEVIKAQNHLMQQELEAFALSKQQLEQRLEQLGQGIESYQVQMNELHRQNTGLRTKAQEKDLGLQEAGRMLCDLELQTAHLTQALDRVNDRHAQKQQQLERAEQKLQQFLSSRSYRLTAPLRGLRASLFRKKLV